MPPKSQLKKLVKTFINDEAIEVNDGEYEEEMSSQRIPKKCKGKGKGRPTAKVSVAIIKIYRLLQLNESLI